MKQDATRKVPKRDINSVYSKKFLDSFRNSPWGKTQDQKMGLEFNKENYQEIDMYCKEKKIKWFASAWDLKSQLFLETLIANIIKLHQQCY